MTGMKEKECTDPGNCVTEALAESGRDRDALASLIRKASRFFEADEAWKRRHEARAAERREWETEITQIAKNAAADAAANRADLDAVRQHLEALPAPAETRALSAWWAEHAKKLRRCDEVRAKLQLDLLHYLVIGAVGLAVTALAFGLPEALRRVLGP